MITRPSSLSKEKIKKAIAELTARYLEEMARTKNRPKNMGYYDGVLSQMFLRKRPKFVQSHKEKEGKIAGTFCALIPEELLYATNILPIRLCFGFHDTISVAEEVLPRNLCPLIKSSFGLKMLGILPHFELCDFLIIPTTCDGKKKMADFFSSYAQTLIVDVPNTTETPQARRLWLTELKLLRTEVEKLSGVKMKVKNLRQAMTLLNDKRKLLRRLYSLRKAENPPISGRDSLLVIQASYYDGLNRWMEKTETLCKELEQRMRDGIGTCSEAAPRIMLTGCPILMPNWKIPSVIEESGAIIVTDELCTGLRGFYDLVEVEEWTMDEMLLALAERYLMASCACFTPNQARIDRILRLIRDFKVEGVIYFVLQACHPYNMEAYAVKEALNKVRIPMLKVETDYSQEDIEQLRTRVEAFLEMIEARG